MGVENGMVLGCTKIACNPIYYYPHCLEYKVPEDCKVWFDGCHSCTIGQGGQLESCTKNDICSNGIWYQYCLQYKEDSDFYKAYQNYMKSHNIKVDKLAENIFLIL